MIATVVSLKSSRGSHPCSMKPRLFVGAPEVLSKLVPNSSGLVSSPHHLPDRHGGPDGFTRSHLRAPSSLLSCQLIPQLHMVSAFPILCVFRTFPSSWRKKRIHLKKTFPRNVSRNQPFTKCGLGTPFTGSMKSKLFLY